MKQRYSVEVADIPFGIISDDGDEFVHKIAETVDTKIRDLTANTKYLSTVEAAILLALDYCGEKTKADRKIKSLETQVEILEANLRRLRGESASADVPAAEPVVAVSPAAEPEAVPVPESAPADEVKTATEAAPAPSADTPEDNARRSSKLRAIEALLGSQLKMDLDDEE